MLFAPLMTAALETTLNNLLFNRDYSDQALKAARYRLSGRSLQLKLAESPVPFILVFSPQHVDVLAQWQDESHCTVDTGLSAFIKLHEREPLADLLRSGEIQVEGDLQVLQQFLNLLDLVEWDPAEWLAPYVGDVAAYAVSHHLQSGFNSLRDTLTNKRTYLAETIVEEWRLAPGALEFAHFSDRVEAFAQELERFSHRVEKFKDL